MSGTANQNWPKSNQTGIWVKSKQIFNISTLNLVYRWKTLQHVTMCKGNFVSPKMIDIKQIEFMADAKNALHIRQSKTDTLMQSQVHMKTLENV